MAPFSDAEPQSDDDLVLPALSYGSSSEDEEARPNPSEEEKPLLTERLPKTGMLTTNDSVTCLRPPCRSVALAPRPPQILTAVNDAEYCVKRFHFEELTVAEFRRHCIAGPSPVIITGLAEHMPRHGDVTIGVELLRKVLDPALEVPVRGRGYMAIKDFFARLSDGESVYLADVPVARHFPYLFEYIKTPRYFLHCFSHRTRQDLSIAYDTPALFVGGQGTRSDLHIDNMCSNFWMFLAEGQKHWVTFHPEDAELLSPSFDEEEQIRRFRSLADLQEDSSTRSRLSDARKLEFTMGPGDLVFIPRNTPHEVTNLDLTCAFSANFFDQSNVEEALEQGRARLAQRPLGTDRHRNLKAVLDSLEEIDWPDVGDDIGPGGDSQLPGEQMLGWFPSHERLKGHRPVSFVVS